MRTEEYINKRLSILEDNTYDINILNSNWFKIKLVRQIEQKYKLDIANEIINNDNSPIDKDEKLFNLIKRIFKRKKEINNKSDLVQLDISMIKHIAGNDIIKTERIYKKGKNYKKYMYKLNDVILTYNLRLNKYKNPQFNNIEKRFILNSNQKPDTIDFYDE
jgi:hypothetical protein